MAEFQEVMRKYARMCKTHKESCERCILYPENRSSCRAFMMTDPAHAEELIMLWTAENPEKTMKDVLFEKFPSATVREEGCPSACAHELGFSRPDNCPASCESCWNRPAPEGY